MSISRRSPPAAAIASALCRMLHIEPRRQDVESTRPLVRQGRPAPALRTTNRRASSDAADAMPEVSWLEQLEVREIEMCEEEHRRLFAGQDRRAWTPFLG